MSTQVEIWRYCSFFRFKRENRSNSSSVYFRYSGFHAIAFGYGKMWCGIHANHFRGMDTHILSPGNYIHFYRFLFPFHLHLLLAYLRNSTRFAFYVSITKPKTRNSGTQEWKKLSTLNNTSIIQTKRLHFGKWANWMIN